MRRLGIPRRTTALIGANSLSAAAELIGPLGFAVLLTVIGVGMAATAAGFRRPLVTG